MAISFPAILYRRRNWKNIALILIHIARATLLIMFTGRRVMRLFST